MDRHLTNRNRYSLPQARSTFAATSSSNKVFQASPGSTLQIDGGQVMFIKRKTFLRLMLCLLGFTHDRRLAVPGII
eukprot:1130654-Pelagomonas_calceolata.AAC.5